jgi:hypothetical protein
MSVDEADISERHLEVLGGGTALMNAIAFAYVGMLTLESLPYGAIAGLLTGVGTYLFLPWFLRLQTIQSEGDDSLAISEAARRVDKSTQLGVLGLGLDVGGVVMLAVGFALDEPNLLLGTGAAILVALLIYLVGSVFVDR